MDGLTRKQIQYIGSQGKANGLIAMQVNNDKWIDSHASKQQHAYERTRIQITEPRSRVLLLKNQPIGSLCVTHILPFCGYFKGQEQVCFNPTSWPLVTYNLL